MRKRVRSRLALLLVFLLVLPSIASLPIAGTDGEGGTPVPENGAKSAPARPGGRGVLPTMPDLVLSGLNWSLSAPEDGASLTIMATLFNDGTTVPGRINLNILVDGQVVLGHVVSGLPGGSFATVQAPWIAEPGPHELAAVADPSNAILEANETNNFRLARLDIPFPDLHVANLTWFPKDYRNGDRVDFIVTVANRGSGGTTRPLAVWAFLDQTRLSSQTIDGLGAGNSAQAAFQWTARPGDHTLFVRLDPDNAVREVTKTDNSYTLRLGRDYPDIVVTNISAPANLTDGADALLVATVANTGRAGTFASIPVEFLVDGESAGIVRVEGLPANSTRNVSLAWTARAGRHILRVEADPRGVIDESDETNNFRLIGLQAPYPNLAVRDIRWEQALPTDGRVVDFNITVANTGPGPTARTVRVDLKVDGLGGVTVVAEGLGAGQQVNLTAGWTAVPGKHEVSAEVDPGADIAESDETDNILAREVGVPYPDIALSALALTPPNPEAGQTVTVAVVVTNPGQGNTSRNFPVSFYAGGTRLRTETVQGLGRGAILNLSATWTALPGTTDLTVVADETANILELGELNNRATARLSVAYPDFSVNASAWSPGNAAAGQPLNITASLRNGGANTTLPFRLGLFENGTLVWSVAVSGMRAGELVVQNISFVLGSNPATLRLAADYQDAVPEQSELDNEFVFEYPAGAIHPAAAPSDLAFGAVTYFPDEPVDGDRVTVQAAINQSPPSAQSGPEVEVACILDGVTALVRNVHLSGGEGAAIFELRAQPGTHSILLVIDPGRHVPQDRHDNDRAGLAFSVLPPDPAVTGLALPAANATDGSGVSVACTVANNGPGSTRNGFSVRLLVDGQPRLTQPVGALSNGSKNTITFTFEAYPGTHRLKAEVVRETTMLQADVGNDQASTTLQVERPDLVVASILAPDSADEGSTVTIQTTINNLGATTMRDLSVRLLVDGLRAGDSTVGGMLAGRPTTVVRQWTALPGAHRFTALVDAGGSVGESDESDNRLERLAVNVSPPDLRVAGVRLLQQPLDGADCLVTAEIANPGNLSVSAASVQFYLDEFPAGPVRLVSVPARTNFTVTSHLSIGAGPHVLRATITGGGRAGSANRTDDGAVLAVNGTGFADLSLVGLKAPPSAVDGAAVRLFAEIENRGNATEHPFTVSLLVDGQRAGDCPVQGLPAGGTASVSVAWTASPGKHYVTAIVDRSDEVPELDERDNWMGRDGPAVEPPDIMVGAVSSVPSPIPAIPDRARIFLDVENIGGATLRQVSAVVYFGDRPAGKVFTDGLPARCTTQLSLLAPTAGISAVTVRTDEDGLLSEGDESNNIASFPLDPANITGERPDLSVRRVWMVPPEPSDGESARLFAEIANEGSGPLLNPSQASLAFRGRPMNATVSALTPGGAMVVGFDIIARAGTMVVNVSANPNSTVAESRRDNNWLNLSFSAPVPDIRVVGLVRPNLTEGLKARMFAVVENHDDLSNNTGDAVGRFSVEVFVRGAPLAQVPVNGLLAGETTCLAFDWTPAPGETDIVLWADRLGEVCETGRDNNRLNLLAEAGYPDLAAANITWTPLWQNEEGAGLFVEIQNEGAATGHPASVTLSVDSKVLGTARIDGMEAGARTVLAWKWNIGAGNHTFFAAVDVDDETAESNENNNRLARDFPGGAFGAPPAAVNLRLSGLDFRQQRLTGPGSNNTTTVSNMYRLNFTVSNDGAALTPKFPALLLANGMPVAEFPVEALAANTSVNVSFDWKERYGSYRYKVVLDSRRLIAEDIETDNDQAIPIPENLPPVVSTGGPYSVKQGDPVTFKGNGFDQGGFIALYEWDLDGDGRFGGQNDTASRTTGTLTKIFHRAGRFKVSLRVTDDLGASATETTVVTVAARPPPPGIDMNMLAMAGLAILVVTCVTLVLLILRGEGPVFRRKKE